MTAAMMASYLRVVALLGACAMARGITDSEAFNEWSKTFGRNYATASERESRFAIFKHSTTQKERRAFVNRLNNASNGSTLYALNDFADWTYEELRGTRGYNGLAASNSSSEGEESSNAPHYKGSPRDTMTTPTAYNWCSLKNTCTVVANQGSCGSCWSFAAIAALEMHWAISTGELVSLSQQQPIDCNPQFSKMSCCGGTPEDVYRFVKKYNTRAEYPYVEINSGDTAAACTSQYVCQVHSPVAYVAGYGTSQVLKDQLFTDIFTYGPFVAPFGVEDAFYFYAGGIYSCSTRPVVDHVVVVVGYGTENGVQYLVGRNSWGTSWGERGYFKIASSGSCAIINRYGYSPALRPTVVSGWKCDPTLRPSGACQGECGPNDNPVCCKWCTSTSNSHAAAASLVITAVVGALLALAQ